MDEVQSPAPRLLRTVLGRLGMIVSAAAGFGLLAFVTGFLARRAQHDFAQVPLVFIDYWAYAETGLTGALRSLYLLLEKWPVLVAIGLVSVGIVLALEARGLQALAPACPLDLVRLHGAARDDRGDGRPAVHDHA